MKKTIITLCILALVGCTKEQQLTSVSFNLQGVESGAITKADLAAQIGALLPASPYLSLTIQSKTKAARRYTCILGNSITLPVDTYTITAEYKPRVMAYTINNGEVYQEPRFSISTEVAVTGEQDTYTLPITFDCWAMVIDYASCAKYLHYTNQYEMKDFTFFVDCGTHGVAFINGRYDLPAYAVRAVPADDANYEAKDYTIVTNRNYEGVKVENGKWYGFAPAGCETQNGGFSLSTSTWTNGME